MTPEVIMWIDAIDDGWRWMLFSGCLLGIFGAAILLLLFAGLVVGAVWRWLVRNTFRSVIAAAERKALQ